MNKTPLCAFNGTWIAVGAGAGTAIGVAMKNIAVGVSAGVAFGVVLGFLFRKRA